MKIELPQVGQSVTEGTIGRWLKQVGQRVEKYAPLVEVLTDKVNMEMPSPVAGVLTRIVAQEGETVPMGAVIAEIAVAEEEQVITPPSAAKSGQMPADRIGTLLKNVAPMGPTGSGGPLMETAPSQAAPASAAPPLPPAPTAPEDGPTAPGRYSPVVQRLAAEHRVDLSKVKGTGIGGRVTRKDVEDAIQVKGGAAPPGEARPVAADEERMPLSPMRRIIAEHMVKSATQIPHVWSLVEADVTELAMRREALKEGFRAARGFPLTYLAFVLQAVAESLKEHPLLNSSWGGDAIILKKRVSIGIAVAAPSGLVVPVIRDADTKGIAALAQEVDSLTQKARKGFLALQDVQGGTFTVNNTGALGSVASNPLINYPQAAILTTEAIVKRPVVVNDTVAVRSMMNLVLGFDHRIMDGAEAGAFLQAVKRRLEAMGPETAVG
ncbi:MAG: 2-oxo acid dehydrogenase subunit E2 [SAR202 cluster bacterium]|nr:2-oxo acid dehydrogenase subunit E2 [SAR202 cluster bacterium]